MISAIQSRLAKVRASAFPSSSLRTRFVKGMFWALVGTLISQSLQLMATIFVARWLGKSEYGELGVVRSTIGMFGVFVGLGLGLTATKYVSEVRKEDPERAGRIAGLTLTVSLLSGLVVTAALVVLSPWLAVHTLASPAVALPLAIGSGLLFFGELNGVQTGILSGLEAFRAIARVNLWAGLCSFPIIITLTWLWGINGAVAGLVVSLGLNCFLNNIAMRRESAKVGIRVLFRGSWGERPVLWKFSVPAFLSTAVVTPTTWICNAMLVNQPGGYAEMGLFSAADQWRNVVLFLPGVISRVLLPILSNHSKESVRELTSFSKTLEAGFSAGVAVAFPLVTALSWGGALIASAYGKQYADMTRSLAGVLYAGGVMAVGSSVGSAVQAKGAMWLGFTNNLVWAVLLLGSFHFFLSRGAWGLALAHAISFGSTTFILVWYFCKRGFYPWRLGVRTNLAALVLLTFAFGPVYLPRGLGLPLSPIAVTLSGVATWLFLPKSLSTTIIRTLDWLPGVAKVQEAQDSK